MRFHERSGAACRGWATSIRNRNPFRTEFEQQRIEVFDLTKLAQRGDDAHSRAFEDVTSVVAMIRQRMHQGQQLAERPSNPMDGM